MNFTLLAIRGRLKRWKLQPREECEIRATKVNDRLHPNFPEIMVDLGVEQSLECHMSSADSLLLDRFLFHLNLQQVSLTNQSQKNSPSRAMSGRKEQDIMVTIPNGFSKTTLSSLLGRLN